MRANVLLALLAACGGAPTPEPAADEGAHAANWTHGEAHHGGEHHGGAHGGGEGGQHAHGGAHHDDATMTHRFDDAEKWAEVFDDPERAAWQKPAELVAALSLTPGSTVADIGAGTGYFNPHLSTAVGPEGTVLAIDIEQTLVDHMTRRAEEEGTPNVVARLGAPDNPGLQPNEVELAMMVDVYHHISGRVAYFTALREGVEPGGRLVVVDFKEGELPVGPPPDHRIPQAKVVAELTEAGWEEAGTLDLLPHQFVQIMRRPEP